MFDIAFPPVVCSSGACPIQRVGFVDDDIAAVAFGRCSVVIVFPERCYHQSLLRRKASTFCQRNIDSPIAVVCNGILAVEVTNIAICENERNGQTHRWPQ